MLCGAPLQEGHSLVGILEARPPRRAFRAVIKRSYLPDTQRNMQHSVLRYGMEDGNNTKERQSTEETTSTKCCVHLADGAAIGEAVVHELDHKAHGGGIQMGHGTRHAIAAGGYTAQIQHTYTRFHIHQDAKPMFRRKTKERQHSSTKTYAKRAQ